MLYFYPSNRTENLAFLVAEIMRRKPLSSIFDKELILVQSFGMGTWLQQTIASEIGISALVECKMPGSFIWSLVESRRTSESDVHLFDKASLRWEILARLPEKLSDPKYGLLKRYINAQGDQQINGDLETTGKLSADNLTHRISPHKDVEKGSDDASVKDSFADKKAHLFELSQLLADLFDAYQNYRPEWIVAWESEGHIAESDHEALIARFKRDAKDLYNLKANVQGAFLDNLLFQIDLWRSLYPDLPLSKRQHRATLLTRFAEEIDSSTNASLLTELVNEMRLPERLFVFGLTAIPPAYLPIIESLSKVIDIHWLATNPCQYYWGDVHSEYQRLLWQKALIDKGVSESTAAASLSEGQELLASWGKVGKEYLSILMERQLFSKSHADLVEHLYDDSPVISRSSAALHAIQNSLLNLSEELFEVTHSDQSLVFADCHSPLREVEALKDYILSLFDLDENLSFNDILVMVPNIEEYAPFIEAVFSQPCLDTIGREQTIDYAISDQSILADDSFVDSFIEILGIDRQRLTGRQLLNWLGHEAIRSKLALSESDLELVAKWIKQLNVRWGIDTDQIKEFSKSDNNDTRFTWLNALNRLVTGYFFDSDSPIEWYGRRLLPKAIFGQEQVDLVGKLARLLDLIMGSRKLVASTGTSLELLPRLAQLWHAWVDESLVAKGVTDAFYDCVENLRDQFNAVSYSEAIPFSLIANEVVQSFEQTKSSQRYLTGCINFCTLMPMRTIPFKVVCLLGMNEGAYPRIEQKNSLDLLDYVKPKVGDRNRRDDDRYLFLEAVCSAREKLYLSYCGRDIRDNSPRYPSVLVQELQEYIRKYARLNGDREIQTGEMGTDIVAIWTNTHRLQPFHPEYFTENAESGALGQTFSQEWLSLLSDPRLNGQVSIGDDALSDPSKVLSEPEQFDLFSLSDEQERTFPPVIYKLKLDDFCKAVVMPLQHFYQNKVGLLRPWLEEAFQDSEPFALDGLALFDMKVDALLNTPVSTDDSSMAEYDNELTNKWSLQGKMPVAPVGNAYAESVLESLSPLRKSLVNGSSLHDYPIEFQSELNSSASKLSVMGGFILRSGAILDINLSQSHARPLFSLWVKHVIASADGLMGTYSHDDWSGRTVLLTTDQEIILPVLDRELARSYFNDILQAFDRSLVEPTVFLPKSAYALIFDSEKKALQSFLGFDIGNRSLAGENADLAWQRYCEYQSDWDVNALPEFSSYPIFDQVKTHLEEFEFISLHKETV